MAIRDDFTAGEVLAAADLNDTFASKPPFAYGTATPTTTVEGFIWYDENDTPPTAKFWDGSAFENIAAPVTAPGLVHINTTTFSAVSSVSLNSIFTSTYDSYRIVCNFTKSVAGFVGGRLRVSGTDSSTGYIYANLETNPGSGPTRYGNLTASAFDLGTKSDLASSLVMDLGNPAIAVASNESHTGPGGQAAELWWNAGAGIHTVATAYDGFTLFIISGGGTITGTIRIYGYKNS